ncbi:MAG TPA: type II toxin-antitoxin system RelE/ParE family toxin [Vicinamibacteria bacterium]
MAGRRLRFHPDADQDLDAGLRFYLRHSPIAASRFLDDLTAALEIIREAPARWPLYRLNTRRYVMAAYPYSLIYRATEVEIQVYAVAHAKRRPLYWRKRRLASR